MKFIIDLSLILLFFITYKLYDLYVAIGITMIAYFLQFIIQTLFQRKIDKLQLLLVGFVLILGSSTLLFRNEMFFKWKPTVIYAILALALYITPKFTKKSLLEQMSAHALTLSDKVWNQLNYSWISFFALLAIINIFIAYLFSTDIWVNFKLFGVLGAMIVFIIGQGIFISKHVKHTS